ncbi:hypothetical protein [Sulfolobus tengchongensis spindle-shaped virus 4]|nr:hypothetical protein [Sulfolobus tengchongensis spindle-shaped virus 4]
MPGLQLFIIIIICRPAAAPRLCRRPAIILILF